MTNPKSNSSAKILKKPNLWIQRAYLTLNFLLYIIICTTIIIIYKQNIIIKQTQFVQDAIYNFLSTKGFELQDIIISGRNKTPLSDINKVLNLHRGDNFLKINVTQIKQDLENLPWIRDVTVKKTFLPNILQISIKEKDVLAIWQLNKKFYPLDMEGYVIEADYKATKPSLLIIGEEAPENINHLLQAIKKIDESYISRIIVANYISKRRWNITFDDLTKGVTVKLPEENLEQALTKLINLDKTSSILKRKLTIIDLRLNNKTIVKMRKDNKKH